MDEPKFTQGLWNNCDGETIETKKARICIIAPLNLTQEESDANAALIAAAPDGYEYAETTAEVLRLLLETYKLPEQARKCLQDRIDESEKYRKKARGEA